MPEFRYLSSEELVKVNELVLQEIKVRKADRPRVLSKAKLDRILESVRETEGDVHDKAAALLVGLIRGHPFASGNRRTAFVATRLFLEQNGGKMKVEHDPKILQGIREEFYTTPEIKSWLKGDAVKGFARG
jgi:death on curing protein